MLGCYDMKNCHGYSTLTSRFARMSGAAVYCTVTSLILASVVLVSAQSLSAVASQTRAARTLPPDAPSPTAPTAVVVFPFRRTAVGTPGSSVPPHRLQAWWAWSKWPALLSVIPMFPAVASTMQVCGCVLQSLCGAWHVPCRCVGVCCTLQSRCGSLYAPCRCGRCTWHTVFSVWCMDCTVKWWVLVSRWIR